MSKESDFVDLLNKEMYELKIADLEAKLAEYKKFMKDNEWDSVEEMQETLNKCEKKYFDIQQEFAGRKKLCDLRHKQLQNSHQDKISFAVEQLEKVLKTLEEKQFYKKEDTAYCVHTAQIAEYIDNQINQLKEME